MKGEYTALVTENINAPVEKVWKAITTPELIAKYLYGTKVNSDWKEGGSITYDGVHNGTKYHVMLSQDNIATEAEKIHSEKNWKMTLNELKKVVEGME